MDFNIEVRKKQLQSLDQYITSSKDKVQSILDYLGWNTKKILEKEPEITCSVNSNHVVAMKNVDVHLKKCIIKTSGYQSDDEFLSEPISDPSTFIKLDNELKIEILSKARNNNLKFRPAWNGQDTDPMTSDRMFSTFSSDERLALYDYCVQNTHHPPVPSEFNIQVEVKKEEEVFLSKEELLAKERDAKRRRIKYKSVHTGRSKSHTEITRELIENQMEQYKDYLSSQMEADTIQTNIDQTNEQNFTPTTDIDVTKKENVDIIERPSSSISRHSNHSSNSRNKKDNKDERVYRNDTRDLDYRRDYKEYDKRHDCNGSGYDHSPYREKRRYKNFDDDYRRSRYKKERYHKSERRH